MGRGGAGTAWWRQDGCQAKEWAASFGDGWVWEQTLVRGRRALEGLPSARRWPEFAHRGQWSWVSNQCWFWVWKAVLRGASHFKQNSSLRGRGSSPCTGGLHEDGPFTCSPTPARTTFSSGLLERFWWELETACGGVGGWTRKVRKILQLDLT